MRKIGTSVYGLRAPIVKQGDDLVNIIVDTVLNSGIEIKDRDVLGITESIVARWEGNYVTVDEVAEEIKRISHNAKCISVWKPIYSRNRFAMILKAIARAAEEKVRVIVTNKDEVGNVLRHHPFTRLNYDEYYREIVENEGKECEIINWDEFDGAMRNPDYTIDCRLYSSVADAPKVLEYECSLADICKDRCEFGLYGSNKSNEELLKLFPSQDNAFKLIREVQDKILQETGHLIEVMVYGDGCFKDPIGGIWEFADPVVSPAATEGLFGTPNEIKIKNFADEKYRDLKGEELNNAIKEEIKNKLTNLEGNMSSQGTTPRRYVDLLGSLMDLTSGSGDKGTPFVYVQGYFDNMSNE